MLEHTVVIYIAGRPGEPAGEDQTVPMVILHPEWPEGAHVTQETSDEDLLATILALSPETADVREAVLKTLPGQNLLTLEEVLQMKNENDGK